MQLFNTTTQEFVTLSIVNKNGQDSIADIFSFGNNPDVNYNVDEGRYEISQEAYDFYAPIVAQYQEMTDLIDDIRTNGTVEDIAKLERLEADNMHHETNDYAGYMVQAINAQFGETESSQPVNTALFTVTENASLSGNFGYKLIQSNLHGDYVYASEQVFVEVGYDGVSLLDVLYQNGNGFKGGDYNCPTTKLELYSDADPEVRILDNWASYADDDEKAELVDFFNEKMANAGREERFTEEDIDYLYDLVRSAEPESPSQDVDDYRYDVDLLEWVDDNKYEGDTDKYPVVVDSKSGLTYDELRDLQRESNVEITNVCLA